MNKLFLGLIITFVFAASQSAFAEGDASAGKSKAAVCAACHGADGNSPSDAYPKLAGQGEAYLLKQLKNFKSGERQNAFMAPMVANLSEQDMADLAAYFSSQTIAAGATPEEFVELGKAIYRGGNKESGVPACMACHGPNGSGMPAAKWPALAGQYTAYVEAQLHAFADGARNNDPNSIMRDIASRMSDEEIKAVSAYVSGLK
jgi:cytochrome c553